jgi:hypothetical protein
VLIAAPLAFILYGGPNGGGTTRDPGTGATGGEGAAVTTEATRTPANGDKTAEPAGAGGAAGGDGGTVAGGPGSGTEQSGSETAQPRGGGHSGGATGGSSGGGTAAGSNGEDGGSGGGSDGGGSDGVDPSPSPSPSPCPCEGIGKLVCSLPVVDGACAAPRGLLRPVSGRQDSAG